MAPFHQQKQLQKNEAIATMSELDEIRAILAQTARQQASNAEGLAELKQTAQANIKAIEALRESIAETKAIAESNSRAVLAWESRINQVEEDAQETATSIGANVNYRVDLLAEQVQGLILERRADWAEWREQQAQANTEAAQQFNNLLEDARADRKANAEKFAEMQKSAEEDRKRADQRFAANETEHRAFRENIQTLLAEIQQVWRRLNAS